MATAAKPRAKVIRVHVSQEVIDHAVPKDSRVCMIAEAIQNSFPDASNVSVDIQTCRVTDKKRNLRYIYLTPRAAGVALLQFEVGIKPDPFDMTLKNGHVLRTAKTKQPAADALAKAALRKSRNGQLERVGGKAPPQVGKGMGQLKRRRVFGMRGGKGLEAVAVFDTA